MSYASSSTRYYHEVSPIDHGTGSKISSNVSTRELKQFDLEPTVSIEQRDSSVGWKQKISTLNVFTLIWTSVVVVSATAFLCFLWLQPYRDGQNATWYWIVSNGWTARSVTLLSLAVRTSVSVQAVLAVSMLASLIMERHHVALDTSAQISVLRVANNGPWSLLSTLWGSITNTKLASSWVLLLLITQTLLQFTSTVLLSDLGIGIMITQEGVVNKPVSLSWTGVDVLKQASVNAQIAYWMNNQRDFPTFAESVTTDGVTDARVRDTGSTIRAFVPYGNDTQRTAIKSYAGTATVVDSRVVCVRPQIHPGLSVALDHKYGWLLNGTLLPDPEIQLPGLVATKRPVKTADLNVNGINVNVASANEPAYNVSVNWTQQIPLAHDYGQWNILQKLMSDGPALVSSFDPRYPKLSTYNRAQFTQTATPWIGQGGDYFAPQEPVALLTGHGYEVMNVTLSENLAGLFVPDGPSSFFFSQDQDLNKLVITAQDEWLIFQIPRVHQFRIAISICFDSFASFDTPVNITSSQAITEPVLGPYSTVTGSYDTEEIRNQLGALPSKGTNIDRGIMELHTSADDLRQPVSIWLGQAQASGLLNITFPTQNFLGLSVRAQTLGGIIMCGSCGMILGPTFNLTTEYGNAEQLDIFNDILLSTNNTALAWQAYYTGLGRMAYYDMLPVFDIQGSAGVAWYSRTIFPQSTRGLKGVVIVLAIHVVLITMIVIVFFRMSRFSRLGNNAWQAIAQAQAPLPKWLEAEMSTLTDDQVHDHLKAAGMERRFVRLQRGMDGKRVGAFWN